MGKGTERRIEGNVDKLSGKLKQGVGKATGDDELRGEGKVEELKGKAKDKLGKVEHKVERTIDEAKGAARKLKDEGSERGSSSTAARTKKL